MSILDDSSIEPRWFEKPFRDGSIEYVGVAFIQPVGTGSDDLRIVKSWIFREVGKSETYVTPFGDDGVTTAIRLQVQ